MEYSGAWRKLIHQKNQKQKISGHCPFKLLSIRIKTDWTGFRLGGPVRQPYARVDCILQSGIYEFGYWTLDRL